MDGTITIDGRTYEYDVVTRLSGEVVKRKKKLSKKCYGTSHVLSKDEAKFVFEKGCEQIILGSGQEGTCVQQVACKEDWAFSRDLLKRTTAAHKCVAADIQKIRRKAHAPTGLDGRVGIQNDAVRQSPRLSDDLGFPRVQAVPL